MLRNFLILMALLGLMFIFTSLPALAGPKWSADPNDFPPSVAGYVADAQSAIVSRATDGELVIQHSRHPELAPVLVALVNRGLARPHPSGLIFRTDLTVQQLRNAGARRSGATEVARKAVTSLTTTVEGLEAFMAKQSLYNWGLGIGLVIALFLGITNRMGIGRLTAVIVPGPANAQATKADIGASTAPTAPSASRPDREPAEPALV